MNTCDVVANDSMFQTYIDAIAPFLRNFKRTSFHYNFSCPYCGDSKRNPRRARAYLLVEQGTYRFYCHNCTTSKTFINFLRDHFPHLANQYRLELLKNKQSLFEASNQVQQQERLTSTPILPSLTNEGIDYLKRRSIPMHLWKRFGFVSNAAEYAANYGIGGCLPTSAIVIPYVSRQGLICRLQFRYTSPNKQRYHTITFSQTPSAFGLTHVDTSSPIFVTEGAFDACFLPNAIAVGGSNLISVVKNLGLIAPILVFDNEPANETICKLLQRAIDDGFSVVIWPPDCSYKDINELHLAGYSVEQHICTRVVHGTKARLEFLRWQKKIA